MKQKCISVRFHLENEADCKAWEHLQQANTSHNKAIIATINAYFEPDDTRTAELIRKTIQKCLQGVSIAAVMAEPDSTVTEEENALLDSLDDFLGD